MRYLVAAWALVLALVPTPTYAQSQARVPYVFGGWSLEVRDVSQTETAAFNGITFGAGIALTREVSLEGSAASFASASTEWLTDTSDPNSRLVTQDRDVLVAGALRWSRSCVRAVCAEVVGGAGVNLHVISTTSSDNRPSIEADHSEFLIIGGFDLRMGLNSRLALVPGFRAGYIWRDDYLTGNGGRGPAEPTGTVFSINVTAVYRFK